MALSDLPNWILWIAGGGVVVIGGFIWSKADERYVRRSAYREDQARLEEAREKELNRQQDAMRRMETSMTTMEAEFSAKLAALAVSEQAHHEALRKAMHDIRGDMNASTLGISVQVAQLGGQLTALLTQSNHTPAHA